MGLDDVEVVVAGAVVLRTAPAHERDRAPVWRPRRHRLVVRARQQQGGGAGGEIEEVEMVVQLAQPAGLVLLELEAVEHDGLGRLGRGVARRLGVGVRIAGHQREPPAVGRPGQVAHAAGQVGDPLRLAAPAVEQPDLLHLSRIVAIRQVRDVAPVRAPARGVVRPRMPREPHLLRPVPARQPDVGVVPVLRGIHHGHRIRHPRAVRRDLRIADVPQPGEIVRSDGALGVELGCDGNHYREHCEPDSTH